MLPSRKVLRSVHLVCAGVLGFLVYAPSDSTEGTFELLVAIIFFPLLAITGLTMFLGPKLMRRRVSRAGAQESPQS
jgi:hypothetical protein